MEQSVSQSYQASQPAVGAATDEPGASDAGGNGREPILPPPDEWAELAVGPESLTWQRAGDVRMFLASGAALLLQVAYPTVGAGVTQFSNFAADPWGRLFRTLDFTNVLIYGGPERAAAMGARVRAYHKPIKGKLPDGTRYHALAPEAYAWVHMTLAEAIVRAHERFGRPFTPDEIDRFWSEWRGLGRFLGVRWRDMPETWAEFRPYFDYVVDERLEHTEAVDEVLESLAQPAPPPVKGLNPTVWRVASRPSTRLTHLATVGLLPARLRERLGLRWTRAQVLEFRAAAAAARATTPLLPPALKSFGPAYLRFRRREIERGDVASPEHLPIPPRG